MQENPEQLRPDRCVISFEPRRTSSDYLLVEETRQTKSVWICSRRNQILTPDILNSYIIEIIKCCLTHRLDSYMIHIDRMKGAKLIKKVAHRTNYSDLGMTQIVGIIWSSLSVMHHFHIRILTSPGYKAWIRSITDEVYLQARQILPTIYCRRQFNYALQAYEEVLLMLLPSMFNTVIQSMVTFFSESKIWDLETLIVILLKKILVICKDNEGVIHNLLDIVEASENTKDLKSILKIIYTLLDHVDWRTMDVKLVTRIMHHYRNSMREDKQILKRGYEACLRQGLKFMEQRDVLLVIKTMLGWTHKLNNDSLIEYGNLIEHAASIHDRKQPYSTTISEDIMPVIFESIASDDVYVCLLSTRVLLLMLERSGNLQMLMSPRLFFQDVKMDIKIGKFNSEDKNFLTSFHTQLHKSLMTAIIKHCFSRIVLECIFAIIATLAVEVPCGYTAASSVCIAMAVQEFALANNKLKLEIIYQMHACVIYIMSLVCYIHNAKVFYDYVNSVISRRAELAPQLNPPLSNVYTEQTVHLRKPELYFEDWEARYGLWKCFITASIQ